MSVDIITRVGRIKLRHAVIFLSVCWNQVAETENSQLVDKLCLAFLVIRMVKIKQRISDGDTVHRLGAKPR